jgi:M6 family metalloprotease-like protein
VSVGWLAASFFCALASAVAALGSGASTVTSGPVGPCAPGLPVAGATAGASLPGTVAHSTGELRAAQLLVDFPDAPARYPVSEHRGVFGPADDWFQAVSYSRLSLRVRSTLSWLRLPRRSSEYQGDAAQLLADAVAAADPEIDFSTIDVVYIVPTEGADYNSTFAVLNGFGVRADGVEIRYWIPWSNGFGRNTTYAGGLIHETGHLLGLPDLYQVRRFRTFHFWDVMTDRWPSELFAWHRWKLGWLDPGQVACVTRPGTRVVALTPIETPGGMKAVIVPRGSHVLVAEVRRPIGYDRARCDSGVLIYDVDMTPFKRGPITLYRAHAERERPACGPYWNAAFDLGPREVKTLRLPTWHVRIDVVSKAAERSYVIRVRRAS